MQYNFSEVLLIDGQPYAENGKEFTYEMICRIAVGNNKTEGNNELNYKNYELWKKIAEPSAEFTVEEISRIKDSVAKLWPIVISGTTLDFLDEKTQPISTPKEEVANAN